MAKGRKAKRMARRGATRKEIRQETGLNKRQARRVVRDYRPAPTPPQTSNTPQTSTPPQTSTVTLPPVKGKGVRQGLRIGGVGGISGSDYRTIRQTTGVKNDEKLIKKLDKINKNLRSKGKTGISLNQGALNRIVKRATKGKGGSGRGFGFNTFDFGKGKIGQDIMSRIGSPGSPGRYVKGELVGASEATEPNYLARGMQISPGGRERVRGLGKQYELPEKFKPKDEVVDDGDENGDENGNGTPGGTPGDTPGEPVIPEPEPVDTSLPSEFSGFDLASWATGFRRARSSRRRAGRKAQGLASQKKSPFKSWKK